MSAPGISFQVASQMLQVLLNSIDTGAGTATLEIRAGAPPATVDDTATGAILAIFALPNPSFGLPADANPNAVATAAPVAPANAIGTGVAGWFRVYNRDGLAVHQGDVTETGNGGDAIISDENVVAGAELTVISWTITQPES